jgi:4-hydroxy-tetrahydrodipicolinate reductase
VIQFGLGAIGRAAARLVLQKEGMKLVGAIDQAPQFAGRDLGEALELPRALGIPVSHDAGDVFGKVEADAVIHCTGSSFAVVYDQFAAAARAGLHCVSSCEEALFPQYREPKLAADINELCARHKVAMVGTGVNPGFAMDTLALVLSAVSQRVDAVRVLRVVDAGTRREALQRKVGAGLTEAEFHELAAKKVIRHVGLSESLVMLAAGLGWNLDEVDETIAPVIADGSIRTRYLTVGKGRVAGVRQVAKGLRGQREAVTLELRMYVGAPDPRDHVEIDGEPPLRLTLDGGAPGDLATPAILVNMLPRLMEARPGWHTMMSLALPRYCR